MCGAGVPAPTAKPRGAEVPLGLARLLLFGVGTARVRDAESNRDKARAIWWLGGQADEGKAVRLNEGWCEHPERGML